MPLSWFLYTVLYIMKLIRHFLCCHYEHKHEVILNSRKYNEIYFLNYYTIVLFCVFDNKAQQTSGRKKENKKHNFKGIWRHSIFVRIMAFLCRYVIYFWFWYSHRCISNVKYLLLSLVVSVLKWKPKLCRFVIELASASSQKIGDHTMLILKKCSKANGIIGVTVVLR